MGSVQGRGKTWVVYGLKAGIGLGLLGLTVALNREQIAEVFQHGVSARGMAVGFALYLAGVFLAYGRWYLLVQALDLPLGFWASIRLGLIGTLFNLIIPGAVGGHFVKAAYLCRRQSRKTQAAASVAIDRILGLLGLFLLACVVGTLGWGRLEESTRRLVLVAWGAAGVVAALLAVAFLPVVFQPLATRLAGGRHPKLFLALSELAVMGGAYRRRMGVVVLSLLMACVTHVLNVLAFYVVSRSVLWEVPGLQEHFLIVPLVLFSTAIPLPMGALGVTENVSRGLFELVGHRGGAVAMMAFRVLQYGGGLIALGVYLREPQARESRATGAELAVAAAPRV
jgi:uncharacterized membrane protein YbhN (UPF0104 family)